MLFITPFQEDPRALSDMEPVAPLLGRDGDVSLGGGRSLLSSALLAPRKANTPPAGHPSFSRRRTDPLRAHCCQLLVSSMLLSHLYTFACLASSTRSLSCFDVLLILPGGQSSPPPRSLPSFPSHLGQRMASPLRALAVVTTPPLPCFELGQTSAELGGMGSLLPACPSSMGPHGARPPCSWRLRCP